MAEKFKQRPLRPILEAVVFLGILILVFGLLSWKMGGANMLKTLMFLNKLFGV